MVLGESSMPLIIVSSCDGVSTGLHPMGTQSVHQSLGMAHEDEAVWIRWPYSSTWIYRVYLFI